MAAREVEEAVREATGEDEVGKAEVIEADSDSDHFEDATDSGEGHHDFDRPEEWGEAREEVRGEEDEDDGVKGEEEVKDSTGAVAGSPDYVDESVLESWEGSLEVAELEQRRLEGVGCKLEGNTLYLEGRTMEACDKYTQGLRVVPLRFPQVRECWVS